MVECPPVTPTPFFEDDEHHPGNMDELKFPTGLIGEGEQFTRIVEPPPPIFRHDEQVANIDLQSRRSWRSRTTTRRGINEWYF